MGDIICKWRVANVANLIELVDMLPHEELPNDVFRDRMGAGFMRTPYQLACQLGLYYIDDNNNYIPRFRKSLNEQEAEEYLHHWILRYYAPNPYTPSFRKELTDSIALVPALVEYAEKFPEASYEDACEAIYGEPIGNTGSIMGAINNYSKVIEIDRDHNIHLLPNYKEVLMADRYAKSSFFMAFEDSEEKTLISDKELQVIYYGAPGTGKSFAIDNLTNDDNTVRTTFHPDSDYASFVGAYKPTMEDVPINSIYGESVQYATGKNGHPGTEKKIVYKYVPQAFLKAYVAAWSDLGNPHYLVIEEINRGNCAQIFGDLFQLLDRNNAGSSSYAIHADEDITQFLSDDDKGFASLSDDQKDAIRAFVLHKDNGKTQAVGQDILNGKLLLLPPNLYIWATMNTSDQSLFPIDSAFKRRWNWKYMPIEYHPIDKKTQQPIDWKFQIGDNIYSWGQFLSKINPEIYTLTESSDKQMGYFFAKADNATGIISEDVFLNKVLFYLWTDVFKDFDVSSELFKNKDKNRSFIFTDFFDKDQPHALANLMANFKLDIVDVDINSIEDEDSSEGEALENRQSQRDLSRYSINGEGKNNKRQTVLRSLRKYVEANPSLTAAEVIDKWNKVNPQLPYFILSASDYEARIADLPNQRDRFWSVTTGDGGKVYITNQWNANRINEFMRLVNNSDLGLNIEKVPE